MHDVHGSKDRISKVEKNWKEAISICGEREIPEIVIGGDLWESRASQTLSTLMAVNNALDSARIKDIYVVIAEGNLCKVDQEKTEGYSHVFARRPWVAVVADWISLEYDDCDMFVMSYFPENGSSIDKLHDILKSA